MSQNAAKRSLDQSSAKHPKTYDPKHLPTSIRTDGEICEATVLSQFNLIEKILKPSLDGRKPDAKGCLPKNLAIDLHTAFEYLEAVALEYKTENAQLQKALTESKEESQQLTINLSVANCENRKLEAEIKEIKSNLPCEHMQTQQDSPAELPVIVLENPTKKPYSEIVKSAKTHLQKTD